jgi:hypothetical protein
MPAFGPAPGGRVGLGRAAASGGVGSIVDRKRSALELILHAGKRWMPFDGRHGWMKLKGKALTGG